MNRSKKLECYIIPSCKGLLLTNMLAYWDPSDLNYKENKVLQNDFSALTIEPVFLRGL